VENFGYFGLMRKEIETLRRRIVNTVDMSSQQWRVTNGEKTLESVGSFGPNVVTVIVENHATLSIRRLLARGARRTELECRDLATCSELAGRECHTTGDCFNEKLASTFVGSAHDDILMESLQKASSM
jgi:hypothetical protein